MRQSFFREIMNFVGTIILDQKLRWARSFLNQRSNENSEGVWFLSRVKRWVNLKQNWARQFLD